MCGKKRADERADCESEMTDEKEKLGDRKRRKVSDGRKKGADEKADYDGDMTDEEEKRYTCV